MASKKRFNTMVFPQGFDGNKLLLNIVLLPVNQDPFAEFPTGLAAPSPASAIPFADLQPTFELKIVKGLSEWPIANATAPGREPKAVPVITTAAANKKKLLTAIGAQFGAKINITATDKAPELAETAKFTVNKYLPETYRNAFNFTSPRTPNAKTDDSYHCAIRKDVELNKDWKNNEDLSWGQVFAHILRQPMLAKACGMIYSTEVTVTGPLEELFAKGCYIYADIVDENYSAIQEKLSLDAEGPFIKPYAARVPKLVPGAVNKRPVFAPILFPVLFRLTAIDPEPPKAPWDKIFAELNEYNDGFARIVHAQQPVSTDLLKEAPDGSHPVKDEGIRLAWDDEQILIWYMRQLEEYKENPADPAPGIRIDAPLGVYGYSVDVKEDEDAAAWSSLNLVRCKSAYDIDGAPLGNAAGEQIELPFQVFPSQLHNDTSSPFWLPMYYTGWTGKSLVLKDTDTISIHQIDQNTEKTDDPIPVVKKVAADNRFDEVPPALSLQYGHRYHFRVRMKDISGGGPELKEAIANETPSSTTKWSFKRYIAPGQCRIQKPESLALTTTEFFNEIINPDKTHSFTDDPVIRIQRPTLNYPAVVFTNKYQAAGKDPVALLIQTVQQQKMAGTALNPVQLHPAIADPDVTILSVKVEIETLRLDNLASDTGKENYITLYTTTRNFEGDFENELPLQIEFHDISKLNFGSNDDPFNDPSLTKAAIDAMEKIPLPKARKIRVTVRGVCGDQLPSNESYFGFINDKNPEMDSRYGKTSQFWFYKESGKEEEEPLLMPKGNIPKVQALYLQPDPEYIKRGRPGQYFFFSAETSQQPDIMQRLAQQLGLRVKDNGLTLVGEKGERVVFGCNNKIRHHLAPDGSSITFSTKADLCQHWIACIAYTLNRDWSWDALQDVSFTVGREKNFKKDSAAEREKRDNIGDIEIKHSASFESLMPDAFGTINRQGTTLIFFDAIEPKPERKQDGSEQLRFPDELEVAYFLTPHFKPGHGQPMKFDQAKLQLPCTVNPSQVPKIASVGVAFSKYQKGTKYSYTEPRQKYLWVELEEPVADPHDTLFCRVLHYAPDQLIGNNQQMQEIMQATEEPPVLPIDPEYIRIVTPDQTDDMAGLGTMQAMEKAGDGNDLHYLLPLPPGLHAESAELFGFFNYEFRIGHGHWSNAADNKENLWSTAQGRFGRPLAVAGMQHPAPTLLCNVDRDELRVVVNAPYAKAVWQGKNVTCDPPRTQLHAVLYAQVKQADDLEYRNILLDTRLMNLVKPVIKVTEKPKASSFADAVLATALHSAGAWTIGKTDEIARAQVILSNLTLMNEVSRLKVDAAQQRKLTKVMGDFKKGKAVKMDIETARNVIGAFDALKVKEAAKLGEGVTAKVTNASLLAGTILANYKDLPKTSSITWDNKEIAVLLKQLGLPEDASLSVLVVEVFGNITSLLEHLTYVQDDVLEKVAKASEGNRAIADLLLDRRRKNRQALTSQLGNYRILRTSPLTEVPFVCCPTC